MAHRAIALLFLLLSPSLAFAQATASMLTPVSDGTDGTTFTFLGVPIGAAAADRYIAIFVTGRKFGTGSCSLTSGTINGVAATRHATQAANTVSNNCGLVSLLYAPAAITTGTTASVTLTFAASMVRASLTVVRLTGINTITPASVTASTASDPTATPTIYPMSVGAAVSATHDANTTNATWTGLTESFDAIVEAGGGSRHSGALLVPSTLQSALTVTADWDVTSGNHDTSGLFVTWGRSGPVSTTPTHYVTPTGSGSPSVCAENDPCSLTRAFALAGAASMPPGSYVTIAAGAYNQAQITTTGASGNLGAPIRMVGQGTTSTYITGLRTPLVGSAWTLAPTRTYTYQTACSNTAAPCGFTVSVFGQLWTASTWTAIPVDSRSPPAFAPSGRAFDLDEPVRYTRVTTVDLVEAQHCTFYHNTTTDILYMHPCRESAPTDADRYYAGAFDEGTIIYTGTGDYLTLEQVGFWHTTGLAIEVQPTATGNEFLDLRANGAVFSFNGVDTNVERLVLKQAIVQGPPDASCWSHLSGGVGGITARSCWSFNTSGTSEYVMLIGEDGRAGGDQTFDYVQMERGWNGYISFGNAYMNHFSCWGLDNHCGQAHGTGFTLINGIFSNAQDVLYQEGREFDSFTVTHNLFDGGVLFWCSRDGVHQPGTVCPSNTLTFKNNILRSWVTDTLVEPFLLPSMDCNVYMPFGSGSTIWRVTPVGGVGSDPQYETIAEIQTNTRHEDNAKQYASTAWTNGTIFDDHTSRENYPLDYSLTPGGASLLTTCGTVAGPDTLQQDAEPIEPTAAILRFRFTRR